jgi:predicted phage-related endonuclease
MTSPTKYRRTGHIGMTEAARKARMTSIGGSDAKIIMSGNQMAIERLWAEKRGEMESEDLSEIILINLGNLTEPLNADLFEKEMGFWVTDEQKKVHYPDWDKAHTTLDGLLRVEETSAVFAMVEFKFMFPFGFDKQAALEKYYPQVQHNLMVTELPFGYLSILTGAAQHVILKVEADIMYQSELLKAEQDFWDCVETGRTPGNPVALVPLAERVRIVDMSDSNEWASLAHELKRTITAFKKHESAKKGIKKLMPADAQQAAGKGVTIKLSKDGKLLIDCDKTEVDKLDLEQAWFPPEPKKKKAAPKKKAVANDNTEEAEAA